MDDLCSSCAGSGKASPALLNWKIVHEKLPWGLVLLIGGGFAMAAASRESGLSKLIGAQLVNLQDSMSSTAILVIMCTAATFLTEVSSNTAIANIVLPVLAEMVRTGMGKWEITSKNFYGVNFRTEKIFKIFN